MAIEEVSKTVITSTGDGHSLNNANVANLQALDTVVTLSNGSWYTSPWIGVSGYQLVNWNNASGYFYSYPDWYTKQATGRYACAISALQIASDFYGVPEPVSRAYIYLWNHTSTSEVYTSGGIRYGNTSNAMIGVGFYNYASSYGKNTTYTNAYSPSWNDFVNTVNTCDISIFSAGINSSTGRAVGGKVFLPQYGKDIFSHTVSRISVTQ